MKKKICVCLLLVAVAAGGVVCFRSCSGEGFAHRKPLTEAEEMEWLIERLANAYRAPFSLGPDAVIYRPKAVETVFEEIKAKDRKIIPYLIKGMRHSNGQIRRYCARLLCQIPSPSKEGLAALIEQVNSFPLDGQDSRFPKRVHYSLHELTGMGEILPPANDNKQTDIQAMKDLWLPWWAANKDKLVGTDTGIGLQNDDGTVTPLPLLKQ